VRVTALKYVAWNAAMHTPSATHRHRSRGSMRNEPATPRATTTSSAAAITMRTAPMTSGPAPARLTSTAVTDPVVPHDTAASPINTSPRSRLDGPDTARDDSAPLRKATRMNVGFIGTGTMGQPMLANLVRKGFAVIAYDVVPASLAAAVKLGATGAGSSAEVAKRSDLIVTMLPSSSNVEAVYLGAGGILESVAAGRLCVDMATIDPAVSRRVAAALAQRQVRFLDAPVSGGVPGATDGTLAIMVGGDARDLEEARPALVAMGANVIHVGAVGTGEAAKLCNNLIAGVAAVAVSEAFRIAEGFGVDPKVLTDVISKSSGNTWVMQQAHPVPGLVPRAASSRDYAPGFMTDLMAKDLGLAVNAARELRVPVVVAAAAQQVLRLASSHGLGRKDFTAVYTFLKPSSDQAPV